MDPHTHDRKQLIINTSWGESSSSLLDNMVSMDHHQHSHIFFHDQQHHYVLPSSLDHHSSVWQSSSSDHNNYIIPFSLSNQLVSSPSASSAANSLFFVGSDHRVGPSTNYHHQLTLDHHLYSHHVVHGDQLDEQEEEGGNRKDLPAVNEEDEGRDDHEVDEELSAMKEMMYKIAAMQPVDIDPSTIRKPKRRNVRISDDPQSVSARHRRERISEKMRILQRLVPGGTKMDTASMLDEAIRYVKFLKRQIKHLQQDQNHLHDEQLPRTSSAFLKSSPLFNTSPVNHQSLTVTMASNNQQQQGARFVAAVSPSTATNNRNCSTGISALLHLHDHPEAAKSLDLLNICTSNNSKVHPNMDNKNSIVIQRHRPQMDLFNQVTEFINQR